MPARPLICLAIVGALGIVGGAGGCSQSTPAGGTATLPTAPPTTADPWAVPATITPDYLNKVLAKLNQIDGDAKRDSRTASTITPQFVMDETSIRADSHEVQLTTKDWQSSIDQGFRGIRGVPGDRRMSVISFVTTPCILASVRVDFSAVTDGPPRAYPPWFVGLVPKMATATNPTHWALVYDGFETSGSSPDPRTACATS